MNELDENVVVFSSEDIKENTFENYRTNVVTTIAYLLGVLDEIISNPTQFDEETLYSLRQNKEATITQFLIRILTAYRGSRYVGRTVSAVRPIPFCGVRRLLRARASQYSGSRCRSAALQICCALPFFHG